MDGWPEMLAAVEENLLLARELGVRTVPFDRSLLLPPEPPAPAVAAAQPPAPPVPVPPAPVPQASPDPVPARAVPDAPPAAPSPRRSPAILFVGVPMTGASAALYAKMVAAMACPPQDTAFEPCPPQVSAASADALKKRIHAHNPRVLVLLGREALQTVFFGQSALPRDVWGTCDSRPVVATYHPAHILRFWANDPQGLHKAKQGVWRILKQALARAGLPLPPSEKKS